MIPRCPEAAQWEMFLSEQLSADEDVQLDEHLQTCQHCQTQLEQLTDPATMTEVSGLLHSLSGVAPLPGNMQQELVHSIIGEYSSKHPAEERAKPVIEGYDVQEILGAGSSGIVYRAYDRKLDRTVAIKVLRENATSVQRQRFYQEGKALAALHHLNVASIIEVGESAGHTYLVLEYVAGGSLASYLAGNPQSVRSTVLLLQQLAVAIKKAHDAGIIHRDLKPGNILLDPHYGSAETTGLDRFIPKIIDFGIAKSLDADEDFTKTRDFLGTPSYMAPEQITNTRKTVDQRTDVYALGILLYEMLTGRPPFRAVSPIDTMLQIKHDEPVPPSRLVPKLPLDVENICLKCIEKDPAKRYAGADLLAEDLGRYLIGQPVQARPISRLARLWRWSKRNPGWALATMLLFLILLASATVGPLLAHREHMLREEAASHATQAAYERNRAHQHLNMAGQALDEMLERVLSNLRLQDSAFDDVQRSLVSFAVPFLEDFVQEDDSSDTMQLRQARSLLQLAMVQVKTKDIDKAQATYERSLQLLSKLKPSATLPQESLLKSLSSANMEYGRFLAIHRHQDAQAETYYRLSLDYLDQFNHGNSPGKFLDSYAILYSLLAASIDKQSQRAQEKQQYLKKAIDYRLKLLQQHPERDDLRHYAALTHMNLAIFYRERKLRTEEIEQLREALTLEKQVNQSKSVWIESPYFVSTLQGELAMSLIQINQPDEALVYLKEASRLAESLTVVYPSVEKYAALNKQWKAILTRFVR